MTHPYAQDLVDAVEAMAAANFDTLPGVKFAGFLRKFLIHRLFSIRDAEQITAQVKVSLPQGSMTDDQVEALARAFANVVAKMRDAFEAQGFEDSAEAVCTMASGLVLKLE